MGQKMLKIFCSLILLMTVFFNVQTPDLKVVANTEGDTTVEYAEPPFKAQLDNHATIFYNALESLYKDGKMKTGVGSYDLSTSFDQNTLNKYANGDSTLAKAFIAARDAFVMDFPEIFYVDFSKVTLRLGMKDGTYVLYVNNGSNENYYTSSFASQEAVEAAIVEVNTKKEEMKASLSETTLETPNSIITALHNKLIETTEYTYPSKVDRNVSNIYGTLVSGKANCDGYSRTLKWLLDDFDITNVLVAGVGKNARYEEDDKEVVKNTMEEYHQWNYVKLDGKWYAVDVTWDDPIKVEKQSSDIRTTYLLRGSDMLNENHFPMGAFSEGGQEFKYPELDRLDYGVVVEDVVELGDSSTDLKVAVSLDESTDNNGETTKATKFTVNYKDMGYKALEEQGLYAAVRYGMKEKNSNEFKYYNWEKFIPGEDSVSGNPNLLYDMSVWKELKLQFCITDIDQPYIEDQIIQSYGDIDLSQPENHVVLSKEIVTPFFEKYTPPPFIRTSSPAMSARILPEKTHYEVEYYEELEKIDTTKPVSINISNTSSHIDSKVENITYKNSTYKLPIGTEVVSTIVEFDFTPDSTFQGYENDYHLQIENMRGVDSKKSPNAISILTTYNPKMPCPIYAAVGGPNSAFVMSNPVLVANEDMAENMFQGANEQPLKYGNLNIALVASRTTGSEKENLDNVLGDKMTNAKASSTFELSLGCGSLAAALRPGYHVSVGLPYPEGFHPEDYADVEFRAYHFKMVNGEWVSEEIVCQITPQGLMIIANSFSPFTIVAYEKEKAPVSELKAKPVSVKAETGGGEIKTDNGQIGTYAVEENGSRTFTVTPNDGYMIDKILINNSEVKVEDKSTYTTTFSYDTMKDSNDMKVFFVAKSVVEEEKENNIDSITPVTTPNEVPAPPVYEEKKLNATTKEGVIIKVSGLFARDPSLEFAIDALSQEALTSFEKYSDKAAMLVSGTPNFKKSRASTYQETDITYNIPVETTSTTLDFLTYDVNSDSYTEFEATVSDGIATVTVPNLNAFALFDKTSTKANKTYLKSDYDTAIKLIETDYTPKTWKIFKSKLDDAKAILDNVNVTQEEVNKAKSALVDAQGKLTLRANKDELNTLMKEAQTAFTSGKYTSKSLKALETAIASAKTTFDDAETTQEEVTNAYQLLEEAIKALVELGDKTSLTELLAEIKTLDLSKYTKASVTTLKEAMTSVQVVLDDMQATQKEVDTAKETLLVAKEALVKLANKDELNTLMKEAQTTLTSGKYTSKSLKTLETVIASAKTIFNNEKATQEEVTKAYQTLQTAMKGLVELGDKTALTEILNEAIVLDLTKYTEASTKMLKEAIVDAQKVLEDKEATSSQVEESVNAIKKAIAALEEKTTGENDLPNEDQPADSEDNTNTGDNTSNGDVKTGDETNAVLWATLFVGSACLILIKWRKMLLSK